QLNCHRNSNHYRGLGSGYTFQLSIVSAVIFVVLYGVFGKRDLTTYVCIIQAGMAPIITGASFARSYGLKRQISNLMAGFGIPISFITISILYGNIQMTM